MSDERIDPMRLVCLTHQEPVRWEDAATCRTAGMQLNDPEQPIPERCVIVEEKE